MKDNSYIIFLLTNFILAALLAGCEPATPQTSVSYSGFLTDYSHLESISSTSHRYINPKYDIKNYAKFIIDPVELRFDPGTQDEITSWDKLEKIRAYMRKTLIDTLEPRYAAVAQQPGPGVARIRIALTNVSKSTLFKLGGASLEAEFLDTLTGEQIGALVESQEKRLPFRGYSQWDEAKAVMDDWARRFYNRLEEARGL